MLTRNFIKDLETAYGRNNPIFAEEILQTEKEYSRVAVYCAIRKAVKNGTLMRFCTGVYYLPEQTEFGLCIPSVERVMTKKYMRNGDEVYGIYGRWIMELNFGLSTQVPNTIEIITNNIAARIRETEVRGRRVVLRKSRLPITKDNVAAYTLLELFNMMDMREYSSDVRRCVKDFIAERNVTKDDIMCIADAFPKKAMCKLEESGTLVEMK